MINRLLKLFGLRREPETQKYSLDAALQGALISLAEEQQRSPDEIASSLVASGLALQSEQGELWQRWLSLSPREQQVAALTCLNFTNPQIAARLHLSVETIRTHSRNVQIKFNINSKADLRVLLSDWDFSKWDKK
jgi:DNA-binding CsgD family transcriptional regulator